VSLRVGLVTSTGAEGEAALAWLGSVDDVQARRYEPAHVEGAFNETDVVWVHGESRPDVLPIEAAHGFVAQGGGLLLTLQAASLVGPLGLESVPPNDCRDTVWSHQRDEWWSEELRRLPAYPHVRGIATYGPHVLVEGLHNGTYCWTPSEGEPFAWACYSGGAWPADGRVVAVERAYRIQNPERVVAWEYAVGRGLVLCLGAFTSFAAPDRQLRPQLERLVLNALRAVASPASGPRTWWPSPGTIASASEALPLPEPLEFDGALPLPTDDALMIAGPVQPDQPFDLAGRRAMLVGGELRGIRELWVHPHRAVASWIVRADGDVALGTMVEVTPDVVSRTVQTADRRLLETALVALEHPVALVEYRPGRKRRESVGRGPVDFEIELVTDLRRMWPFAAGCGGNLVYRGRSDGRVVVVASESDDGVMAVFLSRAATVELEPAAGGPPAVRCRIRTTLGSPLFVAVVGGVNQAELQRTLRGIRRLGVAGLVRQRGQRAAVIADARLAVRTDDGSFDRAVEWAKRRLDAFLGDVPAVGRSLLAGYGASQPGWGDGRPGEAWFVGRDACWTSLALLAEGEYSLVRQVIRFLGDRQDVTGKVLHEATTSGQFHFDAADASPLYLLLVGRYLAWSGDRDFVASTWPHVERAVAFCLSTDRDGDGLIEHTGVGHGFGTEAGGSQRVSLYLAAVWQAALCGIARAAEALGQGRFAAECWAHAARATAAIEDRFYDAGRGGYAQELHADGTPSWAQSALHAVPLWLGSANPVRAKHLLEALGGDAFSARWGVRILPVTDPQFAPVGRETGAVWPLCTGWAALAEYRAGLAEPAFRHLRANADLAYSRQRGAFDEALDGLEERAAAGCPDRAWSAAMVVLPLVEGLLGVEPDATAGRITVAPQLPQAWTRLEVLGLRCADSAYDLRLQRRHGALSVAVHRTLGPGLAVTLAPWLPTLPRKVQVDGQEVSPEVTGWGEGLRCAVTLEAAAHQEVLYVLK
jgi:hypothetical protein